ncbi:DUF4336 domain-containing protein [Halorarius litoreus]|uniref:DUF4336 domain-containing protein n=1 Tax=Halorarius litoreus TaxID=2962676 RepID=UPI0020CE087B|nr:DUF4336 domain-containing protein [Halorarius litoreus]
MVRHLATDIWVHEEPLQFFRLEIGRLMTVIRLPDGGLFVQSPAQLTPDLRRQLDDLGEVRFVAAGSKLHGHLYMEQYRAAYPDVELLAAPGLAARRTDLRFDAVLGDAPDARWAESIDQVVLDGHRWITELTFLHRESGTVVMGDYGYHIGPSSPLTTRLVARLAGMYRRVGAPPDLRATVTNEATLRRGIDEVLAWEFDRLVPGHGEVVDHGAKARLQAGYDWLA